MLMYTTTREGRDRETHVLTRGAHSLLATKPSQLARRAVLSKHGRCAVLRGHQAHLLVPCDVIAVWHVWHAPPTTSHLPLAVHAGCRHVESLTFRRADLRLIPPRSQPDPTEEQRYPHGAVQLSQRQRYLHLLSPHPARAPSCGTDTVTRLSPSPSTAAPHTHDGSALTPLYHGAASPDADARTGLDSNVIAAFINAPAATPAGWAMSRAHADIASAWCSNAVWASIRPNASSAAIASASTSAAIAPASSAAIAAASTSAAIAAASSAAIAAASSAAIAASAVWIAPASASAAAAASVSAAAVTSVSAAAVTSTSTAAATCTSAAAVTS
eukprot:CAMPEP_0181198418 /NCGR_PEP_ID=MMETSP1096-20121128/16605_1 /TAXON_ID=156174 ORGANISM="Chrysochromulina ericina, Strain CCMP281" /NCGR_SAMPLE_ID=MMETSP1096 /ASSEMBLY_ACC=CAM_ASM_000453 /LENGTH=328 /DNA_ID=CAMNT_0023288477 /DNA_START=120 /DNA_END=1104 /DNA_ORIENTATION=+